MKKFTGVLCALMLFFALTLFMESGTEATTDIMESFSARYGATLAERFSCELCHPPGVFSQLNSYGEDLADAIVETGGCNEFFPPNTHDVAFGRCEYLHEEGYETPFSSGCTTCHGVTLEGLIAPSCYMCHGKRWTEDGPAPTGDTSMEAGDISEAYVYIESVDSDGDGFSNIDEINANSHPGNANITPGSATMIDASYSKSWRRSWIDESDELEITLVPGMYTSLDLELPIMLEGEGGRVYLTQITETDEGLEIEVPKALLLTLFKDFANSNGGEVAVVARNEYGERVADSATVKLLGNLNTTLVVTGRGQSDPKTWKESTDVTITIKDVKNEIDENGEIMVIGPGGDKALTDVKREGNRVTGTLKADDALAVIGPGMEDVNYTVVVTGPGKANRTAFFATLKVQAVPGDGGGGDECLDFDPPSSHNLPRGECEYLHPPGSDQPFANSCNACHGSDLRGSSFAPSCYLCHETAIWQTVPRTAPRAGK